jgi:hypothetical protein
MPAIPKSSPVRSEAYRRYVAALPCFNCGIEQYSQCAHGDEGKGMGLKTDDRTGYPLCSERPGISGCHHFVGRVLSREDRRKMEQAGAADTKAKLIEQSKDDAKLRALLVKLEILQ